MRFFVRLLLVLACLSAASCDQEKLIEKMSPKAETVVAQAVLEDIRAGNIDAVQARLTPKLKGDPTAAAKLRELVGYFPAGKPLSIKPVGWQINTFNGVHHDGFTYEYQFDKAWVVGSVGLTSVDGTIEVEGVHVYRNTQSIEQINAFNLRDKSAWHWLMLALTCIIPLFCIFAFVVCLRTPMRGRKWPWAIFTLLGMGLLRFVWSTGHISLSVLNVQLLSASAVQMGNGPFVLGISFPIGAVLFLLRRRALMRQEPPALPAAGGGASKE